MTDSRPPILEELDNIAIGPAPVGDILLTARSDRRRRRTVLASVAAVSALLVGGGVITTQVVDGNDESDSQVADVNTDGPTVAPVSHTVTVDAVHQPGGPRLFYFEGALEEIRLERVESSGPVPVRSEVAHAPWSQAWEDLPPGEYTIYAAVRPCGGNCDFLDPPTDRCEDTFDLDADHTVKVEFDYGSPCTVTVAEAMTPQPADLDVDVAFETYTPEPSLSGIASGLARWNPETKVLDYISRLGYSGTCPPKGRVSADGEALNLTLTAITDRECTSDPPRMLVTITGLTEAPAEFTVTEGGEQRTVAITASNLELPCSEAQRRGTDLDVPGPGQPTPEQAVAPYANGTTIREELSNSVVVHELDSDGDVTRTYLVSQRDDGWWPDGWLECVSDTSD